jgi:hypothetical protein
MNALLETFVADALEAADVQGLEYERTDGGSLLYRSASGHAVSVRNAPLAGAVRVLLRTSGGELLSVTDVPVSAARYPDAVVVLGAALAGFASLPALWR